MAPATSILAGDAAASRRQNFESVFPTVRDELVQYVKDRGIPQDAVDWFAKSVEYNVPGGKLTRGLSVVDTVEILKSRALTADEYFKAAILGWCTELLQAFLLITDDIMDQSITRRGHLCWYRNEGVGLAAANDAFLLESSVYWILKKHFRSDPSYINLVELFHLAASQTEIGQMMDMINSPPDKVDLNKFSLERHAVVALHKTTYYSFYLPVAAAMYLCGITDEALYTWMLSIFIPIGEFYTVQDDYLDVAGTPETMGKIGTDIVDGKCTWCIITALAAATPDQRAVLEADYGRKDADAERRVKAVFEEVGIHEKYLEYEARMHAHILGLIEAIPEEGLGHEGGTKLTREVFTIFLDKIYKRQK